MILHAEYEFRKWLEEKNIILTPWQQAIALLFFQQGKAGGKSFLLKTLYEYDQSH